MEHVGAQPVQEPKVEAVESAVAALATVEQLPLDEQVAIFEAVHDTLRRTLATPAAD